jgi:RimJ/RimL family protein N-acetyltransferase
MAGAEPILGELLTRTGPWPRPERRTFEGRLVRLEPVSAEPHAAELYRASHEDEAARQVWTYLFHGPYPDEAAFAAWAEQAERSPDPLFFTVVEQASGRAMGVVSLMRIDPAMGVIEVGNIWYAPALQRTPMPTGAMQLLFAHVFDELGYRRLEWKCNALNEPSRRAALRFGFTFEGVFRQHMVVKGRNRDTAWYAMLDHEWPALRTAYAAWLDPANFDGAGRQLRRLEEVRP